MRFHVSKSSRFLGEIVLGCVLAISVCFNFYIIKGNFCFDAEFLDVYETSKYGDPITLIYNGNKYALMNSSYGYLFTNEYVELTHLYKGTYLESILSHKYMVYGNDCDPDRMFLFCNYQYVIDPYDSYAGGCYYRTDFEFPDVISDNIEEISIYQLSNYVCSITDKEMIKWFSGEQTEIAKKDIVECLRDQVEDIDISEITAYAKFVSIPLEYFLGDLGYIEENKPFESYGEKGIDGGSSSWWDYYFEIQGNFMTVAGPCSGYRCKQFKQLYFE